MSHFSRQLSSSWRLITLIDLFIYSLPIMAARNISYSFFFPFFWPNFIDLMQSCRRSWTLWKCSGGPTRRTASNSSWSGRRPRRRPKRKGWRSTLREGTPASLFGPRSEPRTPSKRAAPRVWPTSDPEIETLLLRDGRRIAPPALCTGFF